MGWINESYPEHEGFVRGWQRVPDGEGPFAGSKLIEIQCPVSLPHAALNIEVAAVQVCCECGWRSPLLRAPLGTRWSPCIVHFADHDRESERNEERERHIGAQHGRSFEKECRYAWREHLATMLPGEFFSRKLYPRP